MTMLVFRKSVDDEEIDGPPMSDSSRISTPSSGSVSPLHARIMQSRQPQEYVPPPWETEGGSFSAPISRSRETGGSEDGESFSSLERQGLSSNTVLSPDGANEGESDSQSSSLLEQTDGQSDLRSGAGSEGGVHDPFNGPQENPEERFGHRIDYSTVDQEGLDEARKESRNLSSSRIARNLGGHTDDAYHIAASEEVRRRLPTESTAPPVPAKSLTMGGDATKLTDSELYGHLAYCRQYAKDRVQPTDEQAKKELNEIRQDYLLVEQELIRRLNHHYDTPMQQVSQSPSTPVVLKENAGEHKLLALPDQLKRFGVERPARATDGNEAVRPATRRELTMRLGALGIKHLVDDSWWGTQKVAESFINWLEENNEKILSSVGQSPKVGSALPAQAQEVAVPATVGSASQPVASASQPIVPNSVTSTPAGPTPAGPPPAGPTPARPTPTGPRINLAQERYIATLLDAIKKYNPDEARTTQQYLYTDPDKIRLVISDLEKTKKAAEARAAAMNAPQEIQSLPSFEEFALPAERAGSPPTIDYQRKTKAMVEKLGITVDPSWYQTSGSIQRLYNAIKHYQSTESSNARVTAEQARRLEVEPEYVHPLVRWRPTPADIRSVQTMLINPIVPYLGYRKDTPEYEKIDKDIKLLGDSGKNPVTPRQRALIMSNLGKLGLKTFNQPVDDPSKYKNIDSSWLSNMKNAHLLISMLNSMAQKSSQAAPETTSEAELLQSAPEIEV